MARRIRLGMVGGGEGAFIGGVHRIAARLDGRFELVAGAFSASADNSVRTAEALGVRGYGRFADMAAAEAARPDGIEAVSVVTPNATHFAVASAFLDAGFDVICDKPVTTTLRDAKALAEKVATSGRVFVLTHNYSGTPMVRQMRAMVAGGAIGAVRYAETRYLQDWMARKIEDSGLKQAVWRSDPKQSGPVGALGDIGTHAHHLLRFVTGAEWAVESAALHTLVPGRVLDDTATVMLSSGAARAVLTCSQVAVGHENDLVLAIYGETGGLTWRQEEPNTLIHAPLGEPPRRLTRAGHGIAPEVAAIGRIPAGHPEGYLEAFATIYSEAADLIEARREGTALPDRLVPGINDGVAGMAFIEDVLRIAGR
ncbi:MAG: Gfo/Idh/MocA family oxidoreductase [Pseudomonadota bacterium]